MEEKTWRDIFSMFLSFFKIGAFTIGGGYAMLPLIEREFVKNRGWVTAEEMVDILALVQSLPGIIAINTSIFIGYKTARYKGAVMAALGMILPSFIIINLIAFLLLNFRDNEYVQLAFSGIRAGVTALIGLAAYGLGKKVLVNRLSYLLAAAALIGLLIFEIHAIFIILSAGFIGFIVYGVFQAGWGGKGTA